MQTNFHDLAEGAHPMGYESLLHWRMQRPLAPAKEMSGIHFSMLRSPYPAFLGQSVSQAIRLACDSRIPSGGARAAPMEAR
jgi:hypothetical protein